MQYREKLSKLGITLTRSGKQTCPQCSNTRKNKTEPCLSVTFTDAAILYKCHNCDWSGAVYYRDKYESKKNYKKPDEPKSATQKDALYKYFLEKRGISKKTIDKYGISYNEQKEIIFPYYKYGELVNVKYRKNLGSGKKTFRQEAETEKTLFGMDIVRDKNALIWTEGEVDVLSLAEQGIYAVSVPQGASENKLECLENCYEFIEQFNTHIIAVDNDAAGDRLKLNLCNRLGHGKCKIVNWKQYKDANEALVAGENLQDFINNASSIAPDGIMTFYDAYDEIYKYNFENDENYYKTGWIEVDRLIKIRTGHLMIISGYPSRGKSTFVDNLLINLSKRYDLKHLIASFESTIASHYNSLLEMYEENTIYNLKRDEKIFGEAFEYIAEHFYRFSIDKLWTIDEICERAELSVAKYGIKTLVIDPYNRLDNEWTDREDKYIGSILSKLCMLAKKLDILVIFVAHPRKPDGEKIPNMYSISGSSDWYNMADYGIIIHRERFDDGKLSNTPTVFIEKVKNFSLGKPSGGTVILHYNQDRRVLKD